MSMNDVQITNPASVTFVSLMALAKCKYRAGTQDHGTQVELSSETGFEKRDSHTHARLGRPT